MSTALQAGLGLDDVAAHVAELLGNSSHIGCLAHRDADADSLGSALAFALSLRQTGRAVHVYVPEPMPRMLAHLPGYETISGDAGDDLDLLFTFDCATVARFGDRERLVAQTPVVVNVDHHISNTRFGTLNVIDPQASATGQVVYELMTALDLPITADVATNLYAALFTDTGGFRHENTTEEALRLGADLVAAGADPAWVALKSYQSRSVSQVKLEGMAVARLRTELGGQLIWSEVTQQMLAESGADMQESEGVIDQLVAIDTMVLAVLFKEVEAGVTKISVRSRDPYDATLVCTPFGGGGHHRAAGAELPEPLESAVPKVLAVARELLRTGG
ncbi:MAG: DHH family phosphoesterase [Candidatus Dormibacteria bacterium]